MKSDTCATCPHWKKDSGSSRYGRCGLIQHDVLMAEAHGVDLGGTYPGRTWNLELNVHTAVVDVVGATTVDAENMFANLITKGTFGCKAHGKKPVKLQAEIDREYAKREKAYQEAMGSAELPHCKTCKWWTEIEHERRRTETVWDDEKKELVYALLRQRDCKCPKIVDVSQSNPQWDSLPDDAAGYSDSEDYAAMFRPGPDFGCVHHEEKE